MALGRPAWVEVRQRLQELLSAEDVGDALETQFSQCFRLLHYISHFLFRSVDSRLCGTITTCGPMPWCPLPTSKCTCPPRLVRATEFKSLCRCSHSIVSTSFFTMQATTPTFIAPKSTPATWAACFVTRPNLSCPTGKPSPVHKQPSTQPASL